MGGPRKLVNAGVNVLLIAVGGPALLWVVSGCNEYSSDVDQVGDLDT